MFANFVGLRAARGQHGTSMQDLLRVTYVPTVAAPSTPNSCSQAQFNSPHTSFDIAKMVDLRLESYRSPCWLYCYAKGKKEIDTHVCNVT